MPTPHSLTRTVPTTGVRSTRPGTTSKPAFTIPSNVRIEDGRLYIPKMGWTRLGPIHRYADGQPLTVRVQAGVRKQAAEVVRLHRVRGAGRPPGCVPTRGDRSGRCRPQRGTGHGQHGRSPCPPRHDRRGRQDQAVPAQDGPAAEGLPIAAAGPAANCANSSARSARRRDNATHQISRKVADTAHTVVLEDLNTKAMTKSAKGTVENPGRNVKQKASLNRSILASGWGQLERKLAYKAGELRFVDPACTSQACSRCGHTAKSNRPSQAVFACGACGFRANADHNAAINILVRAGLPPVPVPARGTGAAARRGALPPWSVARPAKGPPATREPDMRGVNHCI